jgi:hypothetical protein
VGSDAGAVPWRSALYPEDWVPGFTSPDGHALHDFSYAGYRGGGVPLGQDASEQVFEVATEEGDTTPRAQAAIDAAVAAGGGVVHFAEGLHRLDGRLRVGASRVVLRGDGPDRSRLHFTQSAGLDFGGHITFNGALAHGPDVALATDGASRDLVVEVADAADLAPGDDVALGWVISESFREEHGMADTWRAFNDTWQPFFLREVVAVDREATPHRVTLDVPLRYPAKLRDGASLRRRTGALSEVGVESLGLANAVSWDAAWAATQVHVLEMIGVQDAWIRDVASFPSPSAPVEGHGVGAHLQSSGILVKHAKRVTVADSRLALAENRGGGGNGYLFEVRQSNEVLFRDNTARAGRHGFIQNWGFGTTGCVWLRCESSEGVAVLAQELNIGAVGYSEFHHSLAMANLMDSVVVHDGWSAVNRGDWSTGAGHTATESVFWNVQGTGVVRSWQFGPGHVIGTAPGIEVRHELGLPNSRGTEPADRVEGLRRGATLVPPSLYEDQLAKRLAP